MKVNLKLCQKYSTIAVGLSGGRDSMALLHYLLSKKEDLDVDIKAVCVDHGIRECSSEESKKVKDFCDRLGVQCKLYKVDCVSYSKENKLTLEQSARELRYACFEDAIKSGFCEVIATAHHLSDNTETVLMRILRGTGIKGLCGIAEEREGYIRPFLGVKREEIDRYIEENKIEYFEDETNTDTKYTRNFIRHDVLPEIKKRYPSVDESIERLSKLARSDEEYFDAITDGKLLTLGLGAYGVLVEDATYDAIFSRLVRKAFYKLGVTADVEDRHIELIKNLLSGENGDSLDMPYGACVSLEYDKLVFYKKRDISSEEILYDECEMEIDLGEGYRSRKTSNREKGGLCIDFDKARGGVFRYRREGDSFKRFGGGTKSLGDYFTDIKFPKRLRDEVVVLAKGSEVLVVLGVEISDKVKVDDNTRVIAKLTVGKILK